MDQHVILINLTTLADYLRQRLEILESRQEATDGLLQSLLFEILENFPEDGEARVRKILARAKQLEATYPPSADPQASVQWEAFLQQAKLVIQSYLETGREIRPS
jgi:hypothetical protein